MLVKPFSWGLVVTYLDVMKYYQKSNSPILTSNPAFAKTLEKINDYVEKSKFNKNLENYLS